MFTSYYAKHANNRNAVAISIRPPSWYVGKTYPILAPTWELVRGIHSGQLSEAAYTQSYMELIKRRGVSPHKILSNLGEDAILLCYEPPDEFCHRHIIAIWMETELGIVVPELSTYRPPSAVDQCFTF